MNKNFTNRLAWIGIVVENLESLEKMQPVAMVSMYTTHVFDMIIKINYNYSS